MIGGGSGVARLRELAGDRLGRTVLLPGPVPRDEVQAHLRAFDIGSLPQTVDQVGALRYTTKLSEYLAAELPTVTGQLPLAYEFAGDVALAPPVTPPGTSDTSPRWRESWRPSIEPVSSAVARSYPKN